MAISKNPRDDFLALATLIGLVVFIVLFVAYPGKMVLHPVFVEALQRQRISIYFFSDVVDLFVFLSMMAAALIPDIKSTASRRLRILCSGVMTGLFLTHVSLSFYYPNVARKQIGYFYRMPAGESITYPRSPKHPLTPATPVQNPHKKP